MRWPPLKRLRARRRCQPKNLLHRNRRRHPRRWPNRLRPPCHFRRRPLRQHLKRSASLRWCPHGPRLWCTHRRPCGSSRRGRSIRPRRNPAHRHSPPHRHRPRHDRRPPAQSASAQPRRSFRQDWLLEWTQTEPRPIRDWRVSAANRGVCYCASTYPRMAARSRWQSCRRAAIQASIGRACRHTRVALCPGNAGGPTGSRGSRRAGAVPPRRLTRHEHRNRWLSMVGGRGQRSDGGNVHRHASMARNGRVAALLAMTLDRPTTATGCPSAAGPNAYAALRSSRRARRM